MSEKLYAERDSMAQGQAYLDHVMAMTAEGLHSKADIASELAHRDLEIQRLKAERDHWEATAHEQWEHLNGEVERLRSEIDDIRVQLSQNNISKAAAADWMLDILTPNGEK